MGKFMFALLTVFGIELAIFLFGGGTYSNTSLFGMIYNPASLWTNPLYVVIAAAIVISIGAAIVPGNLYQINQLGVYAMVTTVLLTFIASIIHLGTFVNGQLTEIGIDSAKLITSIIIAPFIIGYAITVYEWMRSN